VQLLLNAGADTDALKEKRYKGAVSLATENGHSTIAKLLRSYEES
jgi:hypothetical protein